MLRADRLDNPFHTCEFTSDAPLILAVSGGSDSTALLHLKIEAALRRSLPKIVIATVDHALRPESADEARAVAAQCVALGIPHHTLVWTDPKPASGLQNAARRARHRLLADLAIRSGAQAVLVGHTADDQAETVLMRRSRGDGPGLAGIAPATLFRRHVWFVRPLLGLRRQALRDWLTRREIGWMDDPGNDSLAFERSALRKKVAASADAETRLADALSVAQAEASARLRVAGEAARIIASEVMFEPPLTFRITRFSLLQGHSPDAALHVLRVLLAAAGGADVLPDVPRTFELLRHLQTARPGERSTLARCVVQNRGGDVSLSPEFRAGRQAERPAGPHPWGEFLPLFEREPAAALAALTGNPRLPQLTVKLNS